MMLSDNKQLSVYRSLLNDLTAIYDEREAKSIAYIVFEHLFDVSRMDLNLEPTRLLTESQIIKLVRVKERLLNNEPIQHITESQIFFGMEFTVSKNVLIPRPETEELVRWALSHIPASAKCWEIGTGSGCISIALKSEHPGIEIWASDISEAALKTAKSNAARLKQDVNFLMHDALLEEVPTHLMGIDCIISNPPYIDSEESKSMDQRVVDYEPHIALFTPEDSDALVFYRRIALLGTNALVENGQVFFECHEKFTNQVAEILKEAGYSDIEIKYDFQEKPRMVKGRRSS